MSSHAAPLSLPLGGAITTGVGPAGAATFVLSLEDGARVTYEWATNLQKSWNGYETRESKWAGPRMAFDCAATLVDAEDRAVRSALVQAAAAGSPFLLGLSFEELTLTADASGNVVFVASTALSDWIQIGQRVVVAGLDGTVVNAVVQTSTGTSITLDVAAGTAGLRGGRIMPALAVYLDPQQGFGRFPIRFEQWQLKATAALFGFAGVDAMGAGASLTTFDGYSVFDRPLLCETTAADSMHSLSQLIDLGGIPSAAGGAAVVDWGREVKYEGMLGDDFQWWKKFVYTMRGPVLPFLLPTWRPDLAFVSKTSASVVKVSSANAPQTWFASSAAHKWLQVAQTDGSLVYGKISTMVDNGDGTVTVTLTSSVVTGTPAVISWLELVRFENDAFDVTFSGAFFSVPSQAHVVQR